MKTVHELVRDGMAQEYRRKLIAEQLSHDYGWEIAQMGEELPLRAFLASRIRSPRTAEEIAWAEEEAARHGLK